MTEAELKACRDLISTPPFWNPISKEKFLERYPAAVENGKVALRIIERAYQTRNAGEIQCALVVGFTFGFAPEHKEILCALAIADWHRCHEDVVSALEMLAILESDMPTQIDSHTSTGSGPQHYTK
jgi:hypothetical protein